MVVSFVRSVGNGNGKSAILIHHIDRKLVGDQATALTAIAADVGQQLAHQPRCRLEVSLSRAEVPLLLPVEDPLVVLGVSRAQQMTAVERVTAKAGVSRPIDKLEGRSGHADRQCQKQEA